MAYSSTSALPFLINRFRGYDEVSLQRQVRVSDNHSVLRVDDETKLLIVTVG